MRKIEECRIHTSSDGWQVIVNDKSVYDWTINEPDLGVEALQMLLSDILEFEVEVYHDF